MSKNVQESQSVAPETIAVLQTGVSSMLKLNVNDHVEKKNGLSYLSWAWAWAEVLKTDHQAWWEPELFNHATPDGHRMVPYMLLEDLTAMVKVSVYINDIKRSCVLPVMDHRNKPIENPNSFQVNTAIMRCLAKAIAMHGLGLYIYAGEDLPMEDGEEKKEVKEVKEEKKEVPQQEIENLTLFADGLVNYLNIAKDENGLKSYWKSNQTSIDKLKAAMPDLYAVVLNKFKETKQSFKEQ